MTNPFTAAGATPSPEPAQNPFAVAGATPVQPEAPQIGDPKIDDQIRSHFTSTISAAKKEAVNADGTPKSFGFMDALEAGWQMGDAGLMQRGKLPDKQPPGNMTTMQNIAFSAAQFTGDFPFMMIGGAGGGLTGTPGGPATMLVGAGAGAFGLPAGLRAAMIDSYKNGVYKTPGEFLERSLGIMADTAKAMAVGSLSSAAGGATSGLVQGASPLMQAAAPASAQLIAMTSLAKGIEGHLPSWGDFVTNGFMLFGLKAAEFGAGKLADVYTKTGVHPSTVASDAASDPVIQTDLLSERKIPAAYEDYIDPVYKPEENNAVIAPRPPLEATTPTEEAAQRVAAKIALDPQGPEKPGYTFDKFYAQWVDNLDPVKKATEAMTGGADLPASEDPYKLLRLTRGGFERANQFIQHGTVDFDTYKPNGGSLADAIEPVKDDIEGLRTYMVAKRAVELNSRGITDHPFNIADAQQVASDPAQIAKYDAVSQEVTAYNDRVLEYTRKAGLISEDGEKLFKTMNKSYVPFNRVIPDAEESYGVGAGQQVRNPFKSITGSDKDIIDPIATTIKNTYKLISLAERNYATGQFVKIAGENDFIGEGKLLEKINPPIKAITVQDAEMEKFLEGQGITGVPKDQLTVFRAMRQPLRPDEIAVYNEGNREVYKLDDPELVEALKSSPVGNLNPMLKFVSQFTRVFRTGTILNPDFLPRHIVRQNINGFINSKTGLLPIWSTLRGAASFIGDGDAELLQQWRSSGGMNSEITAWDRRYVQKSIEDIEGSSLVQQMHDAKGDPMAMARLPYNAAQNGLDLAHMAIATHDNFIRFMEFKNTMEEYQQAGVTGKDAILDAAYNSREVLLDNFRRGARMQAVNQIWAFSNLRVQGIDKLARNFSEAPTATAMRISGLIAIPTMLLWWANHDDPRYKEIQDWQRDNFWPILTDDWRTPRDGDVLPTLEGMSRVNSKGETEYNFGSMYRITKPQESGLFFGSSIERFLDFARGEDPEAPIKLVKSLRDAIAPEITPSMLTPMYEQWANKSIFTGGPIVPASAEGLLPQYQYTNYTTELAKGLGKVIGSVPGVGSTEIASPAIIENYVRQWTGGLGMYALQMADYGLRKAGVVPDPIKPSSTLADIPFIRAFVMRFPTASTQSITDFQNRYDEAKRQFATVKYLAQKGSGQAAIALQQSAFGQGEVQLDGIRQALTSQQRFIQLVYDNPSMSASDKRQLIDKSYYMMIQTARMGNKIMDTAVANAHH